MYNFSNQQYDTQHYIHLAKTHKSSTGKVRRSIMSILVTCAIFLLSSDASANDEKTVAVNPVNISETRMALEKWIETQRIISQEKRDLELAREMLSDRIELVEREIKSLREKIGQAKQSIAEADTKRQTLIEENNKLKEASDSLHGTLNTLESRVKALLPQLPDPIRERIKPLSQQLPGNQDQTKLSVAQRFQNVVGILNEVDKFNREISVASEVRKLDNGTSVEVTTVYIGIGKAYYASADRTIAGVGSVSNSQWVWTAKNEVAKQISDAIDMLKNEKVASFVQVPIEIK